MEWGILVYEIKLGIGRECFHSFLLNIFSILMHPDFVYFFSTLQTEIENGRLAMMGFVVQIVYELITGNTVGGEFRRILFGDFELEM